MSDDSDSDDDLFLDSGLNKRKSKDSKKTAARANLLSKVLEDDAQKRQRRGEINEMLKEDSDLLKEAEANLHLAQKEKEKEAERLREEKYDEQRTLDRKLQQAVETAKETEGSSLLGTRPNILKRVLYIDSQPKLNEILKKLPRNSSIKAFLESNRDFVSIVLEKRKLTTKFHEFPDLILNWLWDCAIFDENLAEGAYDTLIAYYTNNVSSSLPLEDMVAQWNRIFICDSSDTKDFRDPDESMLDVSHWFNLWALLLKNTSLSPADSSIVTDSLVKLASIVLSTQFYKRQRIVGVAWENIVTILLERLKSKLNCKEWHSWREETCRQILDIKVSPPLKTAEDSDDVECFLSRALIANAFLQIRGYSGDFGAELALQTFQYCFLSDKWKKGVSQFNQHYEWLSLKGSECEEWKTLSYIICCFHIILDADEKFQMNGPLILACTKVLQSYVMFGLLNVAKHVDKLKEINGMNQWLELLEQQVLALIKVVMPLSSNAHFRRVEVSLSHFKVVINHTKNYAQPLEEQQLNRSKVQSDMNDWLHKPNH